jgi:hypothetical protein
MSAGLLAIRERDLIPQSLINQLNSEDVVAPRGYLDLLAEQTGGLASSYTNDLGAGIEQAFAEAKDYYLVGYVPTQKSSDKYHRIEVRSRRADLNLRHRDGFRYQTEKGGEEPALFAAFQFPELFDDFAFQPGVASDGETLMVGAVISPSSLSFEKQGRESHCRLLLYGVLIDSDGSWVTGGKKFSLAKEFPIKLRDEQLAAFRSRESVTASAQLAAESGDYEMVLVVQQLPAGTVSARSFPLRVD